MEEKINLSTKKNRIDFLYASISDIQSTIRALDAKVLTILVLIILPMSQIGLLTTTFEKLRYCYCIFGSCLAILFIISWLISFTFFILSVLSIDNPAKKVNDDIGVQGLFYGSNIHRKRCLKDLLCFNFESSPFKLSEHAKRMQNIDVEKELIYEQMKLVYIRDMKIRRQKITIISISLTICIGVVSWIIVNII